MKIKDIARKNGWSAEFLEDYVKDSGYMLVGSNSGVLGKFASAPEVRDSDVASIVAGYKQYLVKKKEEDTRQKAEQEAAAQQKQKELSSILITSGFNFDGYTIKKYSGYISGDDAVEVARERQGLFGGRYNTAGEGLMAALVEIRRNALNELKEAAHALGCNAVIGVDFDYITLDPETANAAGQTVYLPYIIGVTANGNAVIIEKNEE